MQWVAVWFFVVCTPNECVLAKQAPELGPPMELYYERNQALTDEVCVVHALNGTMRSEVQGLASLMEAPSGKRVSVVPICFKPEQSSVDADFLVSVPVAIPDCAEQLRAKQ